MTNRRELHTSPPLRAHARAVLDAASEALKKVETAPVESVHEFRLALKRWRAFLRLVSPVIGEEAMALRREATAMAHGLAKTRDIQAAIDALHDCAALAKAKPPATSPRLSGRMAATIAAHLTQLRKTKQSAGLNARKRQEFERKIAHARVALTTWPLEAMTAGAMAVTLSRSYARARKRRPKNWEDTTEAALHKFRKDVIVLRYQAEFARPLWSDVRRTIKNKGQKLRLALGAINDLAVLKRFARRRGPLARWHSALYPAIAACRALHLARAKRISDKFFSERPKTWRRQLKSDTARAPKI